MLGVWDNHGGHLGLPLVMKLLSHPIAYSKSPLYVCTWTTDAGSGPCLRNAHGLEVQNVEILT